MARIFSRVKTFVFVGLCAALSWRVSAEPQSAADACPAPAVPAYALEDIKQHYPGWKIKQPSDFLPASDPYSRWAAYLWFTHRRCPGVAIGKFQPGPELDYAFLLIPATKANTGFRLVVVTRDAKVAVQSQVAASPRAEDGGWTDDDWLIRSVKLNAYFEGPRWAKEKQSDEGILVLGGRAYVVYRHLGKYIAEFTDEVDRDQ